jgi:ParB-like nuclease domain
MSQPVGRVLSLESLPVSELKLDPRNPRQHRDRQINQIARSIKTFGFNVPVLIDSSNKVLAGHGRLLACQKLGWPEVPVVRLVHLTDAQARALSIADNRLTENSTWDDRLLGEIFNDLAALDLDFSLEVTGFDMAEIDLRIEGLSEQAEEAEDTADRLPTTGFSVAVSRPGDLWKLGRHRVLCGNALDARAYETLMAGERAAMVFTDPPYNVPIGGHATGLGSVHHRDFAMASGEMSETGFISFLTLSCSNLARHALPGALHFVCMDWRHIGALMAAGGASYTELMNICVWVKPNAGMGSLYRSQHELIAVFKSGRRSHRNNIQLGKFGRSRSNVWNYPGANSFGRATEEGHLPARKRDFGGQRQNALIGPRHANWPAQRATARIEPREFGTVRQPSGNSPKRGSAWWTREDSNCVPGTQSYPTGL